MVFFDCYKNEREKRDNPWEYIQHASEDGSVTLCGRKVSVKTTWTRGNPHNSSGMCCRRCLAKMDALGKNWA